MCVLGIKKNFFRNSSDTDFEIYSYLENTKDAILCVICYSKKKLKFLGLDSFNITKNELKEILINLLELKMLEISKLTKLLFTITLIEVSSCFRFLFIS